MIEINTKNHWDTIYKTKKSNEVSWTQDVPTISLESIQKLKISKDASIIDIGGGDSKLVDFLLKKGYSNISVLDISDAAILRAKNRLGKGADKVKWIVTDILDFVPTEKYDVWHDRAAFHFQTESDKIEKYLNIVKHAVKSFLIVGTFSVDGPKKCSGLEIKQYDENGIKEKFEKANFENIECKREDHMTPAGAIQNFLFCSFVKNRS
jgi:trans-aconitate methyltransferase